MAHPNDVIIEVYDNGINQMDDVCCNLSNVSQTRAQRMRKALKQFVSMMSKPKPLLITLCCFALLLVNVYSQTAFYPKVNHEKTKQSRGLSAAVSANLVEWSRNSQGKRPEQVLSDFEQLWHNKLIAVVESHDGPSGGYKVINYPLPQQPPQGEERLEVEVTDPEKTLIFDWVQKEGREGKTQIDELGAYGWQFKKGDY